MAGPAEDLPPPNPSDSAAAPIVADATPSNAEIPPSGAEPAVVVPEPVAVEAAAPDASVDDATGSEQPVVEPSLLEKFDAEKKAEAAPVEEAKPEGEKTAEEPKPEGEAEAEPSAEEPTETPEAPVLEPIDYFKDLTIPETLQMDDAQKGEVSAAFDAFRADPVKGAQGLIDLHNKTMTDYAEHLGREQHRVWNETRQGWRNEVMADPVMGGAGFQTEMGKVAQVRDAFASRAKPGTPEYETDMTSFNQFLAITGAGDHPAFLKFLHNAHRFVREAAPPPPDAKPPKDIGKAPGRKGLGSIYTHPTSNPE